MAWAAAMVSESLGQKILDWLNPMHERLRQKEDMTYGELWGLGKLWR